MDQSDIDEYNALTSVLSAYHGYGDWCRQRHLQPKLLKYKSLSEADQRLVPWFPRYLQEMREAIDTDERFLQSIALSSSASFGVPAEPLRWQHASEEDFNKVQSVLTQMMREWTSEGAAEREQCFGKILKTLEERFPVAERPGMKCLLPGIGLGRLLLEMIRRGFQCHGNEFTYHMIVMSFFILNIEDGAHYTIHPFLNRSRNVKDREAQLRGVSFPDANPHERTQFMTENPKIDFSNLMSMVTGSFLDLYGPPDLPFSNEYTPNPETVSFRKENKGAYNVVVTCFFLDTASNIINYLKAVHYCLADDGVWVNFGPLLWHWDEQDTMLEITPQDGSPKKYVPARGLELSRDDLLQLCKDIGFVFEKHESGVKTTYGSDPESLGQFAYECEFWVCTKK